MAKHCALTKINSVTVGYATPARLPNMRPGAGIQCPCASSREIWQEGGNLVTRIRPGLEPTVRIDICESAVLNHFAIKAFCTSRNN
jgi:hypothetical protein